MSLARILILAGAAAAAIIAAVLVNGAGSQKAPVEQAAVSGPSVLVAAKDIPVGATISAEDLAWRPWPAEGVGPEMMTKEASPQGLESVAGAFARMDIDAGAPISARQYVKSGDAHFMAAILKPGARAVSMPIDVESAAGGFILPNDRVDVILTTERDANERGQNVKKVTTSTVLQNVRVLAVDQTYKDAKEGEALQGTSATLELYPRQVETFERAKKQGAVTLALRSVSNSEAAESGGGAKTAPSGDGDQSSSAITMHSFSFKSEASADQ